MSWPNDVTKADLKITYYRGSGPGGQKKNKTSSACRILHVPTGEVASCERHREQTKNRHEAFRKLAEKLKPEMIRAAKVDIHKERLERIRSYHEQRGEVRDSRAPGILFSYEQILDGDLDDLHKAVKAGEASE